MSKEKFNIGNLGLPAKPVVVKNPSTETRPVVERAVEAIHKPKQVEEPPAAPVAVRKISLDLPVDMFKFIKLYCVEHDITMREYLVGIIERDMQAKKGA
mgnify:CR=1 FL=1